MIMNIGAIMKISIMLFALMLCAALQAGEVTYIDDADFLKNLTESVRQAKDDGKHKTTKEILASCKEGSKASVKVSTSPADKVEPSKMYDTFRKKILVHCSGYNCGKCSKLHVNCSTTYPIAKDVVVFNYHAVENKDDRYHAVADSEGRVYPVTEILAFDIDNDIVIAKVEGASFDPFPITSDEPVGSPVAVISNPDNMYYVMTKGHISRYYTSKCTCGKKTCTKSKGNWMSITADYAKGSSGAPILNMSGCIAGMVSSTRSIYYNETKGVHDNLQMVVKSCVPSSFILKLIENTAR